jgi:hypothetical protein
MAVANTLYITVTITAVKSFIVQALGQKMGAPRSARVILARHRVPPIEIRLECRCLQKYFHI